MCLSALYLLVRRRGLFIFLINRRISWSFLIKPGDRCFTRRRDRESINGSFCREPIHDVNMQERGVGKFVSLQ